MLLNFFLERVERSIYSHAQMFQSKPEISSSNSENFFGNQTTSN